MLCDDMRGYDMIGYAMIWYVMLCYAISWVMRRVTVIYDSVVGYVKL